MSKPTGYIGIVASFANPADLLDAAAKLRQAGYKRYDAHSPFPIHGMDDAMGEGRSRVSYFAAGAAICGGFGLLGLIWYVHTQAYPLIISGKPDFSYQAFFPPIFAITVLSAAFGALGSFLGITGVHFNHKLFESDLFGKFSDDGFLIALDADDPQFDPAKTESLLKSLGAIEIELVEAA